MAESLLVNVFVSGQIRTEKRKAGSKIGSRLPVVDMARNNLYRFIRYLKKEGRKYSV